MLVSSMRTAILPACGTPPSFPKVFRKAHFIRRAGRGVWDESRMSTGQMKASFIGGFIWWVGAAPRQRSTRLRLLPAAIRASHILHHFLLHKKALFAAGPPCTAVSSLIYAIQGIIFLVVVFFWFFFFPLLPDANYQRLQPHTTLFVQPRRSP